LALVPTLTTINWLVEMVIYVIRYDNI